MEYCGYFGSDSAEEQPAPTKPGAFPVVLTDVSRIQHFDVGMELRDYFAAKALQGILAHPDEGFNESKSNADTNAKCCYMIADAMLEARKLQPE